MTYAEEAIGTIIPYVGGWLGATIIYFVVMVVLQLRREKWERDRTERTLYMLGKIEGLLTKKK